MIGVNHALWSEYLSVPKAINDERISILARVKALGMHAKVLGFLEGNHEKGKKDVE